MDKEILKSLGLFTLPPAPRKKEKEEKQTDQMLLTNFKDFFKGPAAQDTEMAENETTRQQKKREKHLMQMDNTKRMYIDQILRKSHFCDDFDYFAEVIGIGPDG